MLSLGHEFEDHMYPILLSDWSILILTYFYRIFTAKKWNFTTTSRAGGGRGGWTDLIVRFSSSRREWEIFRARRLLFSRRKETAIAHNLRIRVAFSSSAG